LTEEEQKTHSKLKLNNALFQTSTRPPHPLLTFKAPTKHSAKRSHNFNRSLSSCLSFGSQRSNLETPSYKQKTLEQLGIDVHKFDKGIVGIKRQTSLRKKVPKTNDAKGGNFLI